MKIRQISVEGLFGIFNHVIPLNMDEKITIIIGPNGFGKTAILRMLNGFINSQYSVFRNIPFNKFRVEFDNDSSVEVIKTSAPLEKVEKKEEVIHFYFYELGVEKLSYPLERTYSPLKPNFPIDILDEIIPGLSRITNSSWRYHPTNEILSLPEIIEQFEDILPSKVKLREDIVWQKELKSDIHIRLIETQRLLNWVRTHSKQYSGKPSMLTTVSTYSEETAQLIQSKLAEYGKMSQSLDRTFPTRLMKHQSSPELTIEKLRHQIDELEGKRSRLIEIGLLDKDEDSDFQINLQVTDESTKSILSLYFVDVEEKLGIFSEVASKIDFLRKTVNKKFASSYKEMNFSKEKGFIFKTLHDPSANQNTISPRDLSSGEQHELVLLYELLFKVQPNSLVLIDEPELSLHVGWQAQFLEDLQEITKLADLDILMATHSPDIIQDHWDLTVELKGPEK